MYGLRKVHILGALVFVGILLLLVVPSALAIHTHSSGGDVGPFCTPTPTPACGCDCDDFEVYMTVDAPTHNVGDLIEYRVEVDNVGDCNSTKYVTFDVYWTSNLSYESYMSGWSCSNYGDHLHCGRNDYDWGGSYTYIRMRALAPGSATMDVRNFQVEADYIDSQGTPCPSNTASATTNIQAPTPTPTPTPTPVPAQLGDRVWLDSDADGIQDTGENGFPNVTVELYTNGSCSGSPVQTTTTNNDGLYVFAGLTPGTYSVRFVAPSGYILSPRNQGSDDTKDSDPRRDTGCEENITLSAGENNTSVDAGLYEPTCDATTLWGIDEDDGVLFSIAHYTHICSGDDAAGYVNYDELQWNDNGTLRDVGDDIEAFTLDADGTAYMVKNDSLGPYAAPVLMKFNVYTADPAGDNVVTIIGHINVTFDHGDDNISGLTLHPDTGALYALFRNDSSDDPDHLLIIDKDTGNVISDLGEMTGLGEIVGSGEDLEFDPDGNLYVTDNEDDKLYQIDPATAQIIAVIDDDEEGGLGVSDVKFEGLAWHFIDNILLGTEDNHDLFARLTLESGNNQSFCSLDDLEDVEGVDFIPCATPASLGDKVWYDADRDGIQDSGEVGISNVTVELYDNDDCSGSPTDTTTTNSDGVYTFTGLSAGTYSVKFIVPDGYALSPQNQGGDDSVDSDADPTSGCTGSIVLTSGEEDLTWDAGLYGIGRIGDRVWADTDGDGQQDAGETQGIYNVPVHITGVNDLGQTLDITVTTSVTGYYTLDNLAPGTYTATTPSNFGGFVRTSTSPLSTTLSAGHMEDLTLDFGYIAPTEVQLVSFQAEATTLHVHLSWSVRADDQETPRFRIWRALAGGTWEVLTPEWLTEEYASGREFHYEYLDEGVRAGNVYYYRLESQSGEKFGPWDVRVPDVDDGGSTLSDKRMYFPFVER